MRQVLVLNFQEPIWIQAEITSVQEVRGHIFIDLIEKDELQTKAQASAVIWKTPYRKLRRLYGKKLDKVLQAGMEVQLEAEVSFHEQYGYKLLIQDINTEFTIGTLEQKRLATIEKLQLAGLLNQNKGLSLPKVIQRIALISSPNAAGLEDFLQQIRENPFNYQFQIELFPAAVQGELAEKEILQQFQAIRRKAEKFDVISILRGGGARTDLLAFDSEELCREAATLPLPLLSGIGHERDESILDLVSFAALKTPTAVGEYIIRHNSFFEAELLDLAQQLQDESNERLRSEEQQLSLIADRISEGSRYRLNLSQLELKNVEEILQFLSPQASLNRGYVRLSNENGEIIVQLDQTQAGQTLKAGLKDGTVILKVDRKEKS